MVSRRIVVVAAAVAIIVAAAAGVYVSLQPPGQAKNEILVGFTVSLSGPLSAQGTEQLRAYQICAEWINSQGGIYVRDLGRRLNITLKYYDDGSDPSKVRSLYEKLVTEDRVDLLWPPFGTGNGIAAIPVFEKYGIPVILATQTIATAERIRNLSSNIFLTFMTFENTGMMYGLLVKKLVTDHPELKRIAIIYAETDSTVGWASWTRRVVEEWGLGQVVYTASYPLAATDVSGILLRMRDASPDIVIAFVFGADTNVVISQMKQLNISPKVLIATGPGTTTRDFYTRFDNKTREGIITWTNWYPETDPLLAQFFSTYVSRYGYAPISDIHGLAYKSCIVFKQAVEQAGSLDRSKIKRVLETGSFDTPWGRLRFVNQTVEPPILYWIQYQGGAPKLILVTSGRYPSGTATEPPYASPILYPKPGWG